MGRKDHQPTTKKSPSNPWCCRTESTWRWHPGPLKAINNCTFTLGVAGTRFPEHTHTHKACAVNQSKIHTHTHKPKKAATTKKNWNSTLEHAPNAHADRSRPGHHPYPLQPTYFMFHTFVNFFGGGGGGVDCNRWSRCVCFHHKKKLGNTRTHNHAQCVERDLLFRARPALCACLIGVFFVGGPQRLLRSPRARRRRRWVLMTLFLVVLWLHHVHTTTIALFAVFALEIIVHNHNGTSLELTVSIALHFT